MEFDGVVSMEFTFDVRILMEIDGELSIEFYGTFPCNYMEIEVLILHKIQ